MQDVTAKCFVNHQLFGCCFDQLLQYPGTGTPFTFRIRISFENRFLKLLLKSLGFGGV